MSAFGALFAPRRILFGAGSVTSLAEEAASLGRNVLVCTDPAVAKGAAFPALMESLREAGQRVSVWAEVQPDVPRASVEECVAQHRSANVDVVVGLGGGSSLDSAKVAALLLTHGGQLEAYYGECNVPAPILPVVSVPTTAGTGSEATPVAVVYDPHRASKVGISSPHLVPTVALCDPDLLATCPPGVMAAAGADTLSHLVESFTSVRRAAADVFGSQRVFVGKSDFTDAIALAGVSDVTHGLVAAVKDPTDRAACTLMSRAALAGGLALGSAGTAAAHALQYPIGDLTHTAHGLGVGTLLPYVMRFNLPVRVAEFAALASAAGVPDSPNQLTLAQRGIETLDALLNDIEIPRSLRELGVKLDEVDSIVSSALRAVRLVENNPRPLDAESLRGIVLAAYHGDRSFALAQH